MDSAVDFDVVVVGAGIAGCTAARRLAASGHSVALLERGPQPGAKNLSGGVLYGRIMDDAFPGFSERAPVERRVTRHVLSLLNAGSHVNLDFWDASLAEPANAVTVLRARLDPWLAGECEASGVEVLCGVRVDALLTEGARVVGVRADADELRARVVVAADGVTSFLAKGIGLRGPEPPRRLALGVKSVIALPRATLEDRFRCPDGTGVAYSFVGDATGGVPGGGFLYTNVESVSVGVVVRLDALATQARSSAELHDRFLAHPAVAPLLAGGEVLEYGSHLTIEDGPALASGGLVAAGLVVVGDAAGLTLNTGLTLRGMDLAAASGLAAADAIGAALAASDVSEAALAAYPAALAASFAGRDLRTYARAPQFLANPRLYGDYGRLVADALRRTYAHDLSPRRRLVATARGALRASGIGVRRLAGDALAAVRAL